MDKRKVILSICIITVVVIVTVCIAAVTAKMRKVSDPSETTLNQPTEIGLSNEDKQFIEYNGYTILVYGNSSNISDAYLEQVVTGVEAIQVAYEEDKAKGFVLMYPEFDTCSVLCFDMRSDLYFEDGIYKDWQGFELIEQITEFQELYAKLESKL